ncbi:hypothetical protein [uncultured Gammaproteobacteria bacterium]|nr:hypothetical protein [uncultured Gammaproteobacteria bacterium]
MISRTQFLSNWHFLNSVAGFKKITNLIKSGFLMIIHIYAKVSVYKY